MENIELTVSTIEQQTGWKRPYFQTICQDYDVLRKVSQYDFDLKNKDFQDYCKSRGTLYKAGVSSRFTFTGNHEARKTIFFDEFRFAELQPDGSRKRFTDYDMEGHWQIMLSVKGAMQDCWELFISNT